MTPSSQDLEPCPFCGGASSIEDEHRRGRVIECTDCGANVGAADLDRGIGMWNRRADPYAAYVKQCQENGVLHCSRESWESGNAGAGLDTKTAGTRMGSGLEPGARPSGNPRELAQGDALDAARYRYVRILHPYEFSILVARNIAGEGKFDDLVDSAIATSTSKGEEGR